MPTRVFLLRHAESADPKVFHGAESDIDLSAKGRRQAAAIAEALAKQRPSAVISSGQLRAKETARAIAEASAVPHHVEPLLHERRIGILSGRPFSWNGIWPETLRRWKRGETGYAHEGAESLEDLQARLVPTFRRIVAGHTGKTIVVVAHGIVCKALLLDMFPTFVYDSLGPTRNVALTEVVHDGAAWSLIRLDEYPPEFVVQGLC